MSVSTSRSERESRSSFHTTTTSPWRRCVRSWRSWGRFHRPPEAFQGVSISAIARVEGIAWNTVARWLEHAAAVCRGFNQSRMAGFVVEELQADEIRSFVGGKTRPTWIFVAIEVWSRLWPSTVTGRRSYRNTLALVRDIANRMDFERLPLIVTDGFEFYEKVVRRVFGPAVLYGQVLKTRRHDRIVQVERRARMGAPWRFEEALTNSEDSSTLNTSFIERLNLTIRQGSAYLSRRTLSHARSADKLDGHLELLRCHYNFVRPHGALTFGREVRTPAMQAGLATRRLTFREVFVCPPPSLFSSSQHRHDHLRRAEPVTDRPGQGRASRRLSNS